MSSEIRERINAVNQILSNFAVLPDKKQAWDDLHRLINDEDRNVRRNAAYSLGDAFPHILDKNKAWDDLIQLTNDEDRDVRRIATCSLGAAFPHILDKNKAWGDLHRITNDEDGYRRRGIAYSLGVAFSHIPDKNKAWDDLHRLTNDENCYVRWRAAGALKVAFPHIQDKNKAWNDLYRLTKDEDGYVRQSAADSLGAAFPHVPDKNKAWDDIHRLTKDTEHDVRVCANYSLGRAYIFKATEAESEEVFRKELETALAFFEESSKEAFWQHSNPAHFCRLFYRSFYMLTFKQPKEAEVEEYLAEAKYAAGGSESKEKLLEAVENLAHALREAQKVRKLDIGTMKCDLNTYRQYCEQAAELVEQTKEKAPGATKMLERGLPIIDRRIKELLGEIEEKAKKFCVDSHRTPFEKVSRSVYGYTKGLGDVGYPIAVEVRLNRLSPLLRSMCNVLPGESMRIICSQLNDIEEADLIHKLIIIESALSSINVQQNSMREQLAERDRWIEYLKDVVLKRLDNINYSVLKLKLRSGEIVPMLREIQTELNRLKTIQTDLKNFGLSLAELGNLQQHNIHTVNEEITRLTGEIETKVIPQLPETSDAQRVIEELHDLKQSKGEVWFNRAAALSSLIGLVLTIL
jgi:HEAT repeat protein